MAAATMFSFLRRKVGIKIIAGYLIVIGLMLAIGYLALLQLDRISSGLSRVTDNLSGEWAMSNEISHGVEAAWFYGQAYVASHEQTDLDSFQHEIVQLQILLQRVDALDLTPEHRARFAQIAAEVEQYHLAFERVAQLMVKQDEIELQILEAKVLIIDHNLIAVQASLNTLTSSAGFLAWGNAQNAFQLMRLYTTKYLTSEDERYFTSFDQAYQDMQNALTDLETALDALPIVQQVVIARAAARDYLSGFQGLQANIAARRQVFAEDLDVLEPRITTATDQIVTELRADLEAEEARSRDIVTQMRFWLLVAVAALALIGLALAVIISRNITRPLQQVMQTSQRVAAVDVAALTAQLETLSQGDVRLHLDITAQPLEVRRLDEVGNMARAFNEIIFQLRAAQRAFDRMAAYLSDMAGAAASVAQGDLSVWVAPRSTSDVLGNALHEMIANLRATESAMQRQFERLTALRDIDTMITTRRGLSAALFFLLGKAMQFLGLEAAEIYLVTPGDPPLRRFTRLGLDLGDTSTWASRVADEVHAWVLEVPSLAEPAESQREIPALVGYGQPLVVQGQVNGVLQVFHRAPFTPSAEWTGFLEALCSQAAIAIDNDQLVRGLEDRVALRTAELVAEREALRQSEQRLALHVQQTTLAVIEWESDSTIVAWNPGAESIFGYARAEAVGGLGFELIVLPEDRPQVQQVFAVVVAQRGSVHRISRQRRKDGQLMVCEWNHTPLIDAEGRVIGLASLAQDITDRVRAEEELRRAKEAAEAANRAKSAFLANMSHELRTPLNAIIGFSDLLLRDPALSPEYQQNMTIIHQSGEHLLNLINNVLDMAKIEAGRMTLHEQAFDLPELLNTVLGLFRLRAAEKGLALRLDLDPYAPQHVQADEGKLRQVLLNLLGNAVKFTASGSITLRAGVAPVEPARPAAGASSLRLRFAVEDSGPGIAPEDLAAIFEPFMQTGSGAAAQEGTGLGLPISRQFVRLMGGELTVESEPGRGSIFRFDLPVQRVTEADLQEGDSGPLEAISLAPGQTEPLASIALSTLPAAWLTALRRAALEADASQIERLADEIQSSQPAVAAALRRRAAAFDYDAILAALPAAGTHGGSS